MPILITGGDAGATECGERAKLDLADRLLYTGII
jgi:hypothetical protein